jgi:hypothetical protein
MSHSESVEKPNNSSSAAFWSVLIFAGLIIATINFIQVMSGHDEGHHDTTHHKELHAPSHGSTQQEVHTVPHPSGAGAENSGVKEEEENQGNH